MVQIYWKLIGKVPFPATRDEGVALLGDHKACKVALDHISEDIMVSTIFLVIDHRLDGKKPVLFETMVFGGPLDQSQRRYSHWEDAIAGHKKMVKATKRALKLKDNSNG